MCTNREYHIPNDRHTGSLIGRLLPRLMLKEQGIAPKEMKFGVTEAKKPYIVNHSLDDP